MNNRDKALKLIDYLEKSNKKTLSKQRKADIEYGYLMAYQNIHKEDVEKAWNWIKDKVELSYADYDNFLKAMEELA